MFIFPFAVLQITTFDTSTVLHVSGPNFKVEQVDVMCVSHMKITKLLQTFQMQGRR